MTRLVTPFSPPPSQLPRLSPRQGVRKFTVEEYHKLIDEGFFAANEKFELVEGWIVNKMSRNPPHDVAIFEAQTEIQSHLPPEWIIRVQLAVTLNDSEPEPDLAIVRAPGRAYTGAHPGPTDIAMVIESSATSLEFDRADKGRVYSVARIAVYWILNVIDKQVEVYTEPSGTDANSGYRVQQIFTGDDLVPLVIAGETIAGIPSRQLLP
jgi:Uma2 family endonuclease